MNAEAKVEKKVKFGKKKEFDVEFEDRTPFWERVKTKYLSLNFLLNVVWAIFRYVLLVGIAYVILYPFIAKVAGSFMSKDDFLDVTVKLIPKYPTLDTYKAIITENRYFEALWNTTIVSLLCAVVQMVVTMVIGYGFAKFKFKGNMLLFYCVIFTMVVPHQALRLALFQKFRYFDIFGIIKLIGGEQLNLINTYWPLALLSFGGLAFKNGLYIFLMRQFFRGVPDELEEAAYVDGSGVFKTFIRIIVPLSVPMMITVFIFAFSWQWTDDFYTTMFFTKTSTYLMPNIVTVPASLGAAGFASANVYSSAIINTCALMIILPLVIMYCFCQRYIVQGIERSGIVG
ncbi:MAG: carbohydrate ABC transporter permease [Clostridia bacterium]|nr:carbohydrate ABC transporter permease [Clostridia bacterium]